MSKFMTSVAAAVGLMLVLLPVASAQSSCFIGDDGFDIGCCAIPTPVLPAFPGIAMTGNWAELRGCTPMNLNTVSVFIGAPTFVLCDYAVLGVFVAFPGGETISGTLIAKYVRTWTELPAPTGQVWRFLVNSDLACAPNTASTPCTTPLPKCSFTGGPVHFDGHIDYRCTQTTAGPAFTASMSLTHHQGCLSHPFWSCVPLAGLLAHDESSYHLVAPAPFNFGVGAVPQGPLVGDAVRNSFLRTFPSLIYVCESEEKIGPLGVLANGPNGGCLCAVLDQCTGSPIPCTAATACYQHQALQFFTCCVPGAVNGPNNNFVVAGLPPFNQTGFVALRLGTWGALPQYPSGVGLTLYFGIMTYTNALAACPPPNFPIHLVVGVGSSNMTPAQPFSSAPVCIPPSPPTSSFIDLANVLPVIAGSVAPGYGCLSASDVVFSLNIP